MAHGFRTVLRLAAVVVAVTAVARAASSSTRRPVVDTPLVSPPVLTVVPDLGRSPNDFGPERCVVPSHGIELRPTGTTVTETLLARRHAEPRPVLAPGRHRRPGPAL